MGLDVGKQLGAGAAIAEETRGNERLSGLMAKLFKGKLDMNQLFRWKERERPENPNVAKMCAKLAQFLIHDVDAELIERTHAIPPPVVKWLCDNNYFGLKIPEEYGGMGFAQSEYMKVLQLAATYSGAIVALLSASNTIGAGWPVMAYGSPKQKNKWLPMLAKCPSAFAFTEEKAGSDPSAMETVAIRVYEDPKAPEPYEWEMERPRAIGYRLYGRKWWTTNGPSSAAAFISPVIIVIAKIVNEPDELKMNAGNKDYKPCFGAFIVPTNAEGIKIVQRCEFAGLHGIYNGITDFENCYVPREQLLGKKVVRLHEDASAYLNARQKLGYEPDADDEVEMFCEEGSGFKIALEALNSGRITLAGSCVAMAKNCVSAGKWWGNTRFQWGKLIGQHEAVGSGILVNDLATTFALEAMIWYAALQADEHRDCRMEAATCKVLASERAYQIADNFLQMRGGRGYETAASLAQRGEAPLPAERWWRDARINRIFEGESGTLLRMFVVREGLNDYMERGKIFFEKDHRWQKLKTAAGFGMDLMSNRIPGSLGAMPHVHTLLKPHLRFIEKSARRLANAIILASGKHRHKLPNKQLTLRRIFEIAAELYAMATACSYVAWLKEHFDHVNEHNAGLWNNRFAQLANLYCLEARKRVEQEFAALASNSDAEARGVAKDLLGGGMDAWVKDNIVPTVDTLGLERKE